jgi:hypothetical protein
MSKEQIEEMVDDLMACHTEFYENGELYTDYPDMAENMIDKGWRKQEWISVDERLPETEGDYLVWNKEQKKIEIRFFYRLPPNYPVESHPEIREYFGNFLDYKRITHWMPLPEAPKMKGGAE